MTDSSLHTLADEALMLRFQRQNDEAAFQALASRYAGAALALADGRLRDTGLSNDAVQEALLRVVRQKSRYDARRAFAPWFYTILRNVCRDFFRKEARYRQKMTEFAEQGPSVASSSAPSLAALEEGWAALKDAEREVLTLRLIQGLDFRAVGACLGCTEDAAKKKGQRALRRLRHVLSGKLGSLSLSPSGKRIQ